MAVDSRGQPVDAQDVRVSADIRAQGRPDVRAWKRHALKARLLTEAEEAAEAKPVAAAPPASPTDFLRELIDQKRDAERRAADRTQENQ